MSCLPGIASRVTAATTMLLLSLGCQRAGTTGQPSAGSAVDWSTPRCLVEDATAPTVDTLLVIGARATIIGPPRMPADCDGPRGRPSAAPFVMLADVPADSDGRDILELGLPARNGRRPDVFVTRDLGLLAYAQQRGESLYTTTPLPWRTTYIMLTARAATGASLPSSAERGALARDAVTGDARGAREPFSWLSDSSCAIPPQLRASTAPPLIAYARHDSVARELASRIVSLAASEPTPAWLLLATAEGGPSALRAIPMPESSIPAALAEGRLLAAVLPIERDPRARCGFRNVGRLHAGAIPLVDTREHVIVRRGSGAAFVVAADGSLHFFRRAAR